MWEKIKNSRSFYVVISILLAIASWLYVDAQNPDASVTINNIPVSYVGDEHLEDENLLILDEAPTINVKVSGPRSVITQLNRNNIKITASASEITAAGVYSLDCTINLPSSVTSTSSSPVRITSRSASAIDVTVVKMVGKTVDIIPEFTGTVTEHHFYDEDSFVLQQHQIEIRGEETVVDSVHHCKVVLSESNLSSTWTGWLDVVPCDQEGNQIQSDWLELETTSISVAFYVESEKDLPLTVTLVSGGGATDADATYEVTPKTIKVTAQEVVLDNLEELNIGTVDLGQILTTGEYEFSIDLPTGVSSRDPDVTTAKVTVTVNGLETRRIVTSNIRLVNAPEEYEYEYGDLEVRVRGREEAVELLLSDDIEVTLDLSQVELADQTTVVVPASVEIPGISELGVFGSYNMEVSVRTSTGEDPAGEAVGDPDQVQQAEEPAN